MNHPNSCLETMVAGYAVVSEDNGLGPLVVFFIKGRLSEEKARAQKEAENMGGDVYVVLAVTDWDMTKVFIETSAVKDVLCS